MWAGWQKQQRFCGVSSSRHAQNRSSRGRVPSSCTSDDTSCAQQVIRDSIWRLFVNTLCACCVIQLASLFLAVHPYPMWAWVAEASAWVAAATPRNTHMLDPATRIPRVPTVGGGWVADARAVGSNAYVGLFLAIHPFIPGLLLAMP